MGGREKDSDIRVAGARFQILLPLPFLCLVSWPASLASAGMRDEGDRGGEGCMAGEDGADFKLPCRVVYCLYL